MAASLEEAVASPLLKPAARKRLVKTEEFICAALTAIFEVCSTLRLIYLFVITTCKWSITPISNPNPPL
jgi:hypothetical protein